MRLYTGLLFLLALLDVRACFKGDINDDNRINVVDVVKLVDQVIAEPLGGAHRDPAAASESIRQELTKQLASLQEHDTEALLKRRYDRLMSYGIA